MAIPGKGGIGFETQTPRLMFHKETSRNLGFESENLGILPLRFRRNPGLSKTVTFVVLVGKCSRHIMKEAKWEIYDDLVP